VPSRRLAEHRTEQEHGEIQLDEADHLFHEDAGEGGRDRTGVGQQHGTEGGDGGEQDDAVAAVGGKHQKPQSSKGDDYTHRSISWPDHCGAMADLLVVVVCAGRLAD